MIEPTRNPLEAFRRPDPLEVTLIEARLYQVVSPLLQSADFDDDVSDHLGEHGHHYGERVKKEPSS